MASKASSEERIEALESEVQCLRYVGLPFVGITLINLGVALWYFQQKSEPDWNFISVTLTIFEILLAVALVGGFWMLRSAAQQAAAKEANQVAAEVARETTRKATVEWLRFLQSAGNGSSENDDTDLTDMINSLGKEDESEPEK